MNDMVEMEQVYKESERARVRSETLCSIAQLESEIARVLRSQETMRVANRALRAGSSEILRNMLFSEDHISELEQRVKDGIDAFPEYAFRNNTKLIRALNHELRAERARLSELENRALPCTGNPAAGVRYWCNADNPATVPFLAAFLPFNI
jgi:predicted RNase H-like nuclease (RuvC/YqgF family)